MIRHVYKPSKPEGGKRVFDRLYRGRYRLDGEDRIREVPLRTPDKQIAEQRLSKIILPACFLLMPRWPVFPR
jgi:hypothetical protein